MEDWTKKKPIFIKPNDWQTNLIIQEIQGQEAKERILKGEIEFHLREYEKDIRKQICHELELENQALKDRWSELKKCINTRINDYHFEGHIISPELIELGYILRKIEELEKGENNESNK